MTTSVSRDLELSPENGFVAGSSQAIQAFNATIGEIAGTDIPVLLQGDSGTGKEVYARLIHRLSTQSRTPLTKVSCTILESGQLLAEIRRVLDQAENRNMETGIAVFLDAVDEMSLDCQRVLLAMIQNQESDAGSATRVRLISAAARNLENEVKTGRFRRELYFRIAGVCLRLPAL